MQVNDSVILIRILMSHNSLDTLKRDGKVKAHRRRVSAVVSAGKGKYAHPDGVMLWVCVRPTEWCGVGGKNQSHSRLYGSGSTRVHEPIFARDRLNLFWGGCVPQRLALRGGRSTTLPTMSYRFLEENQTIGTRTTKC